MAPPSPRFLFFLCSLLGCLAMAAPLATAAPSSVAVELLPGTPEIDPVALRDAVARELGAPVVDPDDPAASFTLVVSIDRASSELVVERRSRIGGMSRRVPLPAEPRDALRAAVFLIGNLARDEASDMVRQLRPPPSEGVEEAAPASPAEPEPPSPTASYWLPAPEWKRRGTASRFWVGTALGYDYVGMQGASQVCAGGGDYACTDVSGNDLTVSRSAPQAGRVQGGLGNGNFRSLVSFDYAVTGNLLVGARVGSVYDVYPGHVLNAFPLHFEARATYVFGDAPLFRRGVFPYAVAGAGVSPSTGQVDVTVVPSPPAGAPATPVSAKAWEVSGPAFGSAGLGCRFAITSRFAILLTTRLGVAFGSYSPLLTAGSELGLAYGL